MKPKTKHELVLDIIVLEDMVYVQKHTIATLTKELDEIKKRLESKDETHHQDPKRCDGVSE